jgi:hypothetical protein
VTEPHQDDILDERAAARESYAALLEAGDGWLAPYSVRSKLAVWDFPRAETAIDEAEALIASREAIETRAASLQITPTGKLEQAYESANVDLEDARALAEEQLAALDALVAARAALDRERDVIATVGLLGTEPATEFDAATAAFEADDLPAAVADAADVQALIDGAPDVGRTRVVTAGAAAGGAFVLGTGAIFLARRRRRGRATGRPVAEVATIGAAPAVDPDATAPYATLPGDPAGSAVVQPTDPAQPPDRGDEPP